MAILASVVLVQPLAYLAFVVLVEELVAYLVVDLVVAFNHVACFASGSVVFLDGILGLVHLWFIGCSHLLVPYHLCVLLSFCCHGRMIVGSSTHCFT
jgi:hypothetical protein